MVLKTSPCSSTTGPSSEVVCAGSMPLHFLGSNPSQFHRMCEISYD